MAKRRAALSGRRLDRSRRPADHVQRPGQAAADRHRRQGQRQRRSRARRPSPATSRACATPSSDTARDGPTTITSEYLQVHAEGRQDRDRQGGDDRRPAWDNQCDRDGIRQQDQDDQASAPASAGNSSPSRSKPMIDHTMRTLLAVGAARACRVRCSAWASRQRRRGRRRPTATSRSISRATPAAATPRPRTASWPATSSSRRARCRFTPIASSSTRTPTTRCRRPRTAIR